MRHITIFAATLAAVLVLAAPARAGMVEDCNQQRDPDLRIGGCTAAIRSGQWQGKGLAWTYYNRGNAYNDLSEYRGAIKDYDQSLRLEPDNVQTHLNRGNSYRFLGLYERAAIDWEQAIRFDGPSQARWFQNHLKGKGYYAGAIDGVFNPELSRGLRTCARDPDC